MPVRRFLSRRFGVEAAGSTLGREALGGLTTFLTMAYIVFVNPVFLTAAGIPREGAILATCLSSALGTLLMGLLANYPIGLAPGMGLNAFFTYGICLGAKVPWPTALGLVFWCGVVFFVLTVTGAREVVNRAVPRSLKLAAAVGIGLFIAFIGLQQGGIVASDPHTMVKLGDVTSKPALLTLSGLAVTLILMAAGVRTAIFWGMAAGVGLAFATGAVALPDRVAEVPALRLPGLEIDLLGALRLDYLPLLFVLLFFQVFDTLGTLMAVAQQAGLLRNGELPRAARAMSADAAASVVGAVLGTSTVTAYIESGAGVGVGARTGLANLVTAAGFVAAIFFLPVLSVVGEGMVVDGRTFNPVTAPALLVVGTLMASAVREIDWSDPTEAAPAFFTILLMPLTFSISHGLAVGILLYVLVKLAARRFREVHWLMGVLAAAFAARYALLPV
jgi:AGZA family xanthine/uracil permease-like MFS transporter